MLGEREDAIKVVQAGHRRLDDDQGMRTTGKRCHGRTGEPGGAVDQHKLAGLFFRQSTRLLANPGDELAGIVRAWGETGMRHGATPCPRDHDRSGHPVVEADRAGRADESANTAPLATERIDRGSAVGATHAHGVETAGGGAPSAATTCCGLDMRLPAGPEVLATLGFGSEDQVKIGGVDIAVRQHDGLRERGKAGGQAGFAGPTLARKNDPAPSCHYPSPGRLPGSNGTAGGSPEERRRSADRRHTPQLFFGLRGSHPEPRSLRGDSSRGSSSRISRHD